MKNECNIIKDILPLYAEKMVSEDTVDFIEEHLQAEQREYYRELLTFDYYLRENAKTRPEFAGENKLSKENSRLFYEKEAEERKYLPAYQQYDKNQMRKMTHLAI